MDKVYCTKCENVIHNERYQMGYDICVDCSTEQKVSGHMVYPHKTGGYVQVMKTERAEELNKLDRRGYRGSKAYHIPNVKFKKKKEPRVYRNSSVNKIVLLSDDDSTKKVLDYFDEWGYQPTIRYLQELSRNGDIALKQRVRLQDIITDMELNPSPRALSRKFKIKNFSSNTKL